MFYFCNICFSTQERDLSEVTDRLVATQHEKERAIQQLSLFQAKCVELEQKLKNSAVAVAAAHRTAQQRQTTSVKSEQSASATKAERLMSLPQTSSRAATVHKNADNSRLRSLHSSSDTKSSLMPPTSQQAMAIELSALEVCLLFVSLVN